MSLLLEIMFASYKLQFQENTVRAATLMRDLVQRRQDVLDKVDISANMIDVCILREDKQQIGIDADEAHNEDAIGDEQKQSESVAQLLELLKDLELSGLHKENELYRRPMGKLKAEADGGAHGKYKLSKSSSSKTPCRSSRWKRTQRTRQGSGWGCWEETRRQRASCPTTSRTDTRSRQSRTAACLISTGWITWLAMWRLCPSARSRRRTSPWVVSCCVWVVCVYIGYHIVLSTVDRSVAQIAIPMSVLLHKQPILPLDER